jgi:Ni/Fe-hydrogenase 1 B-type cytochrome subunit
MDTTPLDTSPDTSLNVPVIANSEPAKVTIYVWDVPVRIIHWATVIAIGVLTVTGIYIANPFIETTGPATDQYLMGTIRFIHIVAAFVFTAAVLFRLYWAFMGGLYARWHQFLPSTRARLRGLVRMLGYYTFLRKRPPEVVGHNALAGLTYLGLYILFFVQIATGFALLSLPDTSGVWKAAFGWIILRFGAQPVRLAHDLLMFLFLAFVVHHVYSALLIDIEERSGLVSSMITGYKALAARHIADAADQVPSRRRRRGRSEQVGHE